MPPVRRHRIGDQLPAVVHPGPDPAAFDLCRELAAETDAQAIVLFGSRAGGGWDEQCDLDMIIIHDAADSEDGRAAIQQALAGLRERRYPGCDDYHSPHHGVVEGLMIETPQNYHASRRTLNHVIARAAREGCIFTGDPSAAEDFRHGGEVSNEWELVTKERLREAREANRGLAGLYLMWRHRPLTGTVATRTAGRNAHGLLWHSGAALLSILGVIYPRTRRRRWPPPSPGTTPAGAMPGAATWNASTSTPAAGARWWSPIPSTTCRPCGEISKVTVSPCGNGSAHSAVTTSLKRSRPQIRKPDRPPPMPETTVRYSKPPDRCRRKS